MTFRNKCIECNGELVPKGYEHKEKVGRWTVTNRATIVPQCVNCGAPSLTLDELEKYQLFAAKTVLCENKLEGPVVRYARKTLGLTQKELGALLDYQHETISKWENEKEQIPRAAGAALIGLLYRAIDGEKPDEMVKKATETNSPENPDSEIMVFRKAM